MKPYEYRYQVRPYKLVSCAHCGQSSLDYAEPVWEEPIERTLLADWTVAKRMRAASEQAERSLRPKALGVAVGRFFDQSFHPDYHIDQKWLDSQTTEDAKKIDRWIKPSVGAI